MINEILWITNHHSLQAGQYNFIFWNYCTAVYHYKIQSSDSSEFAM